MAGTAQLVLVVDDDQAIRETMAWILADAGYRVCEAVDGRDALRMLRESEASLVVLLDNRMPGMDGVAMLMLVAADAALAARHTFVLITAERATMARTILQLLAQLEIPIVGKPFEIDDLLEVVAQAARRLRLRPPDPATSLPTS